MFQTVTTVVLAVAGQQPEKLTTSTERGVAHVQVQSGPAWVTCQDANAVAAHAYGWATARVEAREYLPTIAKRKPEPARSAASVILRHIGFTAPQVYRTVDEHPYLEVIVGSLRTRVYDQAAAESIAQSWDRALVLARAIWGEHAPVINAAAAGKVVAGRVGLPIARPGLPPQP